MNCLVTCELDLKALLSCPSCYTHNQLVLSHITLLLWRQEEGVLPVVEIVPPGHAECDAFAVRAVQIVGFPV